LSNIRVLVVDDSREMREFVTQYVLEPNGFEVVEAINGAEGVRKALEGDIDLVLLDLEMPRMDGFEVLDTLRARHSQVPVVLMTSHGSESIVVEVFRKGVRDYVIKPFTADEMLATIERALSEVRLQREKEALTTRLIQSKQQLEQRLRELGTLSRIGKSVTALMGRDKLLGRIVDAALYITGSEESAIFLQAGRGGELEEHVRRRRVEGDERQVSRRTEDQLVAEAMRKGDAMTTSAMLSVPLKVGQTPIGVLCVSNKVTARSFSNHDRRLLMACNGLNRPRSGRKNRYGSCLNVTLPPAWWKNSWPSPTPSRWAVYAKGRLLSLPISAALATLVPRPRLRYWWTCLTVTSPWPSKLS